jgi:ABC-type glycerol-3-phosphate transport system permease component
MEIKRTFSTTKSLRTSVVVFFVIALAVVFALPFIWMILTTFKATPDVFKNMTPLSWKTFIPPNPTLINLDIVLNRWHFQTNMLNSLIAATGQVVANLIVCSMAAFAFSRLHFPGRDLLFGLVIFTAFIPFEIVMVPLFTIVKSVHLTRSYLGYYLPWIASPFAIFLLRQAFLEIPKEYDEAAMVEGASYFRIFWNIDIPLIRSALLTQALISFLWGWNAFLWPLIVMEDPKKKLVQVAVAQFIEPMRPSWGELFAAASLATVPILIVFIILQRYYVRGVVLSGMK